jgi:predicted nucleic acid-binding protein
MGEPRQYMDSCSFIDMAKEQFGKQATATEDDLWHLRKLMEAAKNGELEIYTSTLTVAECTHISGPNDPRLEVPEEVKLLFKKMLTSGQVVKLVQDTILVAERARNLLWEQGLYFRGADAIHVASALEAKCTELITTDGPMLKWKDAMAAKGLRIIPAHETDLLPPHYRQALLSAPPA